MQTELVQRKIIKALQATNPIRMRDLMRLFTTADRPTARKQIADWYIEGKVGILGEGKRHAPAMVEGLILPHIEEQPVAPIEPTGAVESVRRGRKSMTEQQVIDRLNAVLDASPSGIRWRAIPRPFSPKHRKLIETTLVQWRKEGKVIIKGRGVPLDPYMVCRP